MFTREKNAAELLSNALVDGFSDEIISTGTLKTAIYFLYLHEIITYKTFVKLLKVTNHSFWYPMEYFEDGTISYAFSKENTVKKEVDESRVVKLNLREILLGIIETLKNDENIHEFFSLDSFEDLLLSAKHMPVCRDFNGMVQYLAKSKAQAVIYKEVLFYFVTCEKSYILFFSLTDKKSPVWVSSASVKIEGGLEGEIIHLGDDFYFKYKNAAAYLHLNVTTGLREIIQNVIILGWDKRGHLLYRDVDEGKVYLKKNDSNKAICKYEEGRKYVIKENYVLVICEGWLEKPKRVYFNGRTGEASQLEKSQVFWEYYLEKNTIIQTPYSFSGEMTKDQVWSTINGRKMTLDFIRKMTDLIKKRKLCLENEINPLLDIIKYAEEIGVGKEEDIVDEVYARFMKYWDSNAKKQVFPEWDKIYIGVFDIIDKELVTIVKPVEYGRVTEREVVYCDETRKWRGSVAYDLFTDEIVIKWANEDFDSVREVCEAFEVKSRDIRVFLDDPEREAYEDDDEDDLVDENDEDDDCLFDLDEIDLDNLPFD